MCANGGFAVLLKLFSIIILAVPAKPYIALTMEED